MIAKIINGKLVAKKIKMEILKKVRINTMSGKKPPGLAVILIGKNEASKIYINKKYSFCKSIGFSFYLYNFQKKISEKKLLNLIKKLNKNKKIHGILIQLPLPKNFNHSRIFKKIDPKKDIDGFHPYNIGHLFQKSSKLRPCTSYGIIQLLKFYKIKLSGLHAVIVGSSNIVGKPIGLELLLLGCTITITHKFTKNLHNYIKQADLLIVAIGRKNFIPGKWIKKGAIVIDVGINRQKNGKVIGDVCFKTARKKAKWITPVPGGVGPMTVAIAAKNTLKSYENFN